MIVVIQCAATKRASAGHLHTANGDRVVFVAQPHQAPQASGIHYARPDDLAGTGETWRERLAQVNCNVGNNHDGLLQADELYENPIYRALARKVGTEHLFILSAGWGLIPASYVLPVYDITFSAMAEPYKRRKPRDHYADFRLLPSDAEGPILFFGGNQYVPLFASLTDQCRAERVVFHSSSVPPSQPGCRVMRYPTTTRTNWHYECARDFVQDRLSLA